MPTSPFNALPTQVGALPNSNSPLLVTIDHVMGRTGWSRQRVYRLLTAGSLRAVKDGSRTLILWESVLSYIASLPIATFKAPGSGMKDPRQGELPLECSPHSVEGSDA